MKMCLQLLDCDGSVFRTLKIPDVTMCRRWGDGEMGVGWGEWGAQSREAKVAACVFVCVGGWSAVMMLHVLVA